MKNLISLLFLLNALLITSCKDDFKDSKVVDFETFQMDLPANWNQFTQIGYDSRVGGITNGKDTLTYDFGWYSYDFRNETTATHTRTETTIDGHDALIVRPKKKGKGIIGVFVQVDSLGKFTMSGVSKNESTILKIFNSIKFE